MLDKKQSPKNQTEAAPEIQAFLYQQVQDLEPYLKDLGSLFVSVDQIQGDEKGKDKFGVTFVIAPEGLNLRAREQADSIFEACMLAKAEILKLANELMNANGSSPERQLAIQSIINKNYYLH